MTDKWEWRSNGLYDGDVPIIWPASVQGVLYVGVMEDWADLIASVPTLARSGTLLHPFAMATNWNNKHLVKDSIQAWALWYLRKGIVLAWRVLWMMIWEYIKRSWGGRGGNDDQADEGAKRMLFDM
jgi:hypothetical protein